MSEIDWTPFDQYPEDMIECHCGAFFRSHAKFRMGGDMPPHLKTRKPCPACGRDDNPRAARSEPEQVVIGGNE